MREESINRLNNEKVYKFKEFLYYDDFLFMNEENKNKEIEKDNKILYFLPFNDCDKNKIYYWCHYWGFVEDYYLYTKDLCECKYMTLSEKNNNLEICKECLKTKLIFEA